MKTLKDVKNAMTANGSADVTINGQVYYFSSALIGRAIVEGLYRQLSQETAGNDSEEKRAEILARWTKGYFTPRDEKDATKVVESKSAGAKFQPDPKDLLSAAIKIAGKGDKEKLQKMPVESVGKALAIALEKIPGHPLVVAYAAMKADWESAQAERQAAIDAEVAALLGLD